MFENAYRALPIALVLLMMSVNSSACGSVAHSFYQVKDETDKRRLEAFLQSQSCGGDLKFDPDVAEEHVMVVLINAARAGVSQDIFEDVLARFNCVARRQTQSEYRLLIEHVGRERYGQICSADKLARVYIVDADGGANLRTSPSMDAQIIAAVQKGWVAVDGETHGDWIKVTTFFGEGYMHASTLRTYLSH